jgi:hypothetical protein
MMIIHGWAMTRAVYIDDGRAFKAGNLTFGSFDCRRRCKLGRGVNLDVVDDGGRS